MSEVSDFASEGAYHSFREYLGIKKHFDNVGYDFFKYDGAISAGFDNFSTRSDVFFFYKLSKIRHKRELLISNLCLDPSLWIGDIIDETGEDTYHEWKGRVDSLSYHIAQESKSALKKNYAENFEVKGTSGFPHIIEAVIQRDISLETFTVLSNKAKVIPYWESTLKKKFLAKDMILRAKKYYGFIPIDHQSVNRSIKSYFNFD